jgi:hypothetical protein
LDSLAWSKKYEILSISRLVLSSLGFTNEQINALTDEDLDRIAYWLENQIRDQGFDESLKFIVSLELAEKGVPLHAIEEPLCKLVLLRQVPCSAEW